MILRWLNHRHWIYQETIPYFRFVEGGRIVNAPRRVRRWWHRMPGETRLRNWLIDQTYGPRKIV